MSWSVAWGIKLIVLRDPIISARYMVLSIRREVISSGRLVIQTQGLATSSMLRRLCILREQLIAPLSCAIWHTVSLLNVEVSFVQVHPRGSVLRSSGSTLNSNSGTEKSTEKMSNGFYRFWKAALRKGFHYSHFWIGNGRFGTAPESTCSTWGFDLLDSEWWESPWSVAIHHCSVRTPNHAETSSSCVRSQRCGIRRFHRKPARHSGCWSITFEWSDRWCVLWEDYFGYSWGESLVARTLFACSSVLNWYGE